MKKQAVLLLLLLALCFPLFAGGEEAGAGGAAVTLEDLAAQLDNLRIADTDTVEKESVEIELVLDQYAYYGAQEAYLGNLKKNEKNAYCLVAVNPGERYYISTGSNKLVAPVIWYSSMEIGNAAYVNSVPPNDSPVTSKFANTVTVPEGVRCMMVQTGNYTNWPISVSRETVAVLRVDRLADAGYVTRAELEKEASVQGDYFARFAYNEEESGTVQISGVFKAGSQIACHLRPVNGATKGNKLSSRLVRYYAVSFDGMETQIAMDYAYNYPTAVIPENTEAIKVFYPSKLDAGQNDLVFCVYAMDMEREPNIITVDQDGYGDFTTLRAALDSITDSDQINRYEIRIRPGVYNVLDDYSSEEILSNGFIGPIVGEGVALVGDQASRENIVIHGELDPELYTAKKRNDVSTLNMIGTCELRGLTVTARKIRYAIHDDLGEKGFQKSVHTFIDCVFRGDELTSGDIASRAFGAGGANMKQYYFKNCVFQDMLYIHTQEKSYASPSCVIEDCTAKVFCVRDVNSGKNAYFKLSNNNFGLICYRHSDDEHEQFIRLSGSGGNSPFIYAYTPFVYEIGDTVRFRNTRIEAGCAVQMTPSLDAAVAASAENLAGVSLGCIDGDTVVLRSGYVDATLFGLGDLALGDYVGVDETGRVVKQAEADGAIGQVKKLLGPESHPFILLL